MSKKIFSAKSNKVTQSFALVLIPAGLRRLPHFLLLGSVQEKLYTDVPTYLLAPLRPTWRETSEEEPPEPPDRPNTPTPTNESPEPLSPPPISHSPVPVKVPKATSALHPWTKALAANTLQPRLKTLRSVTFCEGTSVKTRSSHTSPHIHTASTAASHTRAYHTAVVSQAHSVRLAHMPVFQSPDYCSLGNGHPSTDSMQPLVSNGHATGPPTTSPNTSPRPLTAIPHPRLAEEDEDEEDIPGIRIRKGRRSWGEATSREKALAFLLLLALLALAIVLALFLSGVLRRDVAVCRTAGCVRAAANLLSAVDRSVNPCEDFYAYACGAWTREHPIPDDMPSFGTFAYVRERVRQQMRRLLEDRNSGDALGSKAVAKAQAAYHGCMDSDKRNALNSSELWASVNELGGWPILGGTGESDLTTLLGNARHKFAHEAFFSLYVYADAKDTDHNVLYIDQGSLALGRGSRDYYLNDTLFGHQLKAYQDFVGSVVRLIAQDAGVSSAAVDAPIEDMLRLEKRLAKLMMPEAERRNHSRMYNKWTLRNVTEIVTAINWDAYLNAVLPADVRSLVTPDTVIIACEVDYLKSMNTLLLEEPHELLVNYVLWRFVQGWVKTLDERFDDVKQTFLRAMTGQEEKSPRWKDCVPQPITWMPLATGALYVHHHFDSKDKTEALEMIHNLRASFQEIVLQLDWMDPNTRETAVAKAKDMLNHIGYPDFIKNTTKLDDYYSTLDVSTDQSYFKLVQAMLVWTQAKELRRLKDPFKKEEFEVSPAIVNAFYSPEKNAITFPAGILQPPFFNGEFPKAINYGAMGAVIGHEITHGFDDQGSQFDANGNLNNWWSKAAYAGFRERTQCIVAQYSGYEAYRKYIDTLGHEEERLPGFANHTNDQIFFLSYAHFWCGHKKREAAIQQILTDEHSPEMFRVIGVLSNLDEFANAYNCPKGSVLNPVPSSSAKCTVW